MIYLHDCHTHSPLLAPCGPISPNLLREQHLPGIWWACLPEDLRKGRLLALTTAFIKVMSLKATTGTYLPPSFLSPIIHSKVPSPSADTSTSLGNLCHEVSQTLIPQGSVSLVTILLFSCLPFTVTTGQGGTKRHPPGPCWFHI